MRWAGASMMLVASAAASAGGSPADLVDPFVGTLADFGQLSPAAVAPFGMVQLGPDTEPANHAGYDFAATRLAGFSHTRGVGVGCGGGGGDLLVSLRYAEARGFAMMDKRRERASAGRYAVRYDGGIDAAAVATRGGGVLRFTMPRSGAAVLRIDPRHGYAKRIAARWITTGADDLRADMTAGTVCDVGAYRLFSATRVTVDGRTPRATPVIGAADVATLTLPVRAGAVVEVRTGLSTVDAAGAALVRDRELGRRPFAALAADTRAAWNRVLGRVTPVGDRRRRALFYTSLFRVFQTPSAIDDPDGRHRDKEGRIERSPAGETRYSGWSL